MFHPPTTENKQQNDPLRNQLQAEHNKEISPPVSATSGRSWLGTAGSATSPGLPPQKTALSLARLHSSYGNQAVLRMLSRPAPAIQTKLTVNQPGDAFEQKANRVADQVTRIPALVSVQRKCSACAEEEKLQRKCDKCEEEEKKTELHRKETDAGPQFAPASVHQVLNSPGQPLDPATRAFMEARFGQDFSHVRVHTDQRAMQSAQAVSALAYTVGNHISFAEGQFDPHAAGGRRLLAHELAHVIQQEGGISRRAAAGATPANASVLSRQKADAASEARISSACKQVRPTFKFGTRLRFGQDSDQPLAGQEALIAQMVTEANAAEVSELHGNASQEGNAAYNVNLSCRRAMTVAALVAKAGVAVPPALFAHGATGLYGNEDIDNRNVVLVATAKPKAEKKTCGVTGAFDNIPSGTLPATLDSRDQVTWELGARFAMTADFTPVVGPGEDPGKCNCRCGEYRQCVKATQTINGEPVSPPRCAPTAHSNDFCSGEFHEDCLPTENGDLKYGYHDIFFQTSQFSKPDQATGCRYEGVDDPSTKGHKGDLLGLQAHFQGKLIDTCNNNEVLDSSEWEVFGSARVPS